MLRVLVIGLGLEGLIAGWVFRQHPHIDVLQIGGARSTTLQEQFVHQECTGILLRELGIPHASFMPQDVMLLHGGFVRFPVDMKKTATPERALADWRRKAGFVHLSGRALTRTLRGRGAQAPKRRLRYEVSDLAYALEHDARITACPDWKLHPGRIEVWGSNIAYDFAVCTEPLWETSPRVWFDTPAGAHGVDTIYEVEARSMKELRRYDRVLTPYTPGNAIFEISERGSRFYAKASAFSREEAVVSDLNFLFPDGYAVESRANAIGELHPLRARAKWPEHVQPLGAYTQWNREVGVDGVINGAYDLMRRWLR